jgi:hypothetical protein
VRPSILAVFRLTTNSNLGRCLNREFARLVTLEDAINSIVLTRRASLRKLAGCPSYVAPWSRRSKRTVRSESAPARGCVLIKSRFVTAT